MEADDLAGAKRLERVLAELAPGIDEEFAGLSLEEARQLAERALEPTEIPESQQYRYRVLGAAIAELPLTACERLAELRFIAAAIQPECVPRLEGVLLDAAVAGGDWLEQAEGRMAILMQTTTSSIDVGVVMALEAWYDDQASPG